MNSVCRSGQVPALFVTERRDHSAPHARTRDTLSENKVNGPEDAIVSEMIKRLPIYTVTRCFQERFMGMMESPGSWKMVKLVFLRKRDAAPTKGIISYRAIALASVMSKWYATCILLRSEKEMETEKWEKLHLGGLDGKSANTCK